MPMEEGRSPATRAEPPDYIVNSEFYWERSGDRERGIVALISIDGKWRNHLGIAIFPPRWAVGIRLHYS